MESLELIILSNLIHNESFVRRAIPHIKSEYFNGQHRVIYDLILEFVSKFNKLPNSTTLDIDYRASDNIDRNDRNEILHAIKSLSEYTPVDMDWLLIETEKFCKDRAINLAIIEAVSIIDGKNSTLATGAIPELLAKALAVSFDSSVGHSYIGDSEDRYEFYHRKETKIPFDIDILNKITNGGVTKKTLNIILAGVHVGKSLGLCHMAAAALASGKNALYITLEMAEERIAERIDANLFDVNIKDISNLSKNSFDNKIKGITSKSKGDLIIKEYPTGAAHVGHFRALLMELKQKKNFVPDIIFIDYMNICTSSRIKGGLSGSVNTYSLIKSIAEEIRGLAVEFNVPIWTATQLNRTGYSNSDADMTDTSECIYINEMVTLRNGSFKTMNDINIGDQILANDEFKTVMFKHHNKMKDCVRITTESGKSIIVSKQHIFPTKNSAGIISRCSVSTGLMIGDKLHTK